jgi:hypothetical protein
MTPIRGPCEGALQLARQRWGGPAERATRGSAIGTSSTAEPLHPREAIGARPGAEEPAENQAWFQGRYGIRFGSFRAIAAQGRGLFEVAQCFVLRFPRCAGGAN